MNILDQILDVKKQEVAELKKRYSRSSFSSMEFFNKDSLRFSDKLNNDKSLAVIAEIKKASPSKGIIRNDFNHKNIANIYVENHTDAISILTDHKFFSGDINYLNDLAKEKTVPLLRKDFIIDEFQVLESKANGADFILLICEALSKEQIAELSYIANETGLEVLLELHSESQLDKIDFGLNNLIGINNRNLFDFSVNIKTSLNISGLLPSNIFCISESGINSRADIQKLKEGGINGVLVGEYLMRSKDTGKTLAQLKQWCEDES